MGKVSRKAVSLAGTARDKTADVQVPINANMAVVAVDDPYEEGRKILVMRSIRDDPLGHMRSHDRVDEAQYTAGRYWQALYERGAIGGIQAMDPGKEYVDGGSCPDIITEGQRMATKRLAAASRALGLMGDQLVHQVLADGLFLNQVAAIHGETSRREMDGWIFMFRKCMETLAVEFGFATAPRPQLNVDNPAS